jgi:hypothetical protein
MIDTIPGFWVDMVMPFTNEGRVDPLGILKLLAFLESQGVETVVVGSNFGEGQFELGKDWRVVFKALQKGKGKLRVVVCVDLAKPTHHEWMVRQLHQAKLDGILVYPARDQASISTTSDGQVSYYLETIAFIPTALTDHQPQNDGDMYPAHFTVVTNDLIFQVSRWGNFGAYRLEDGPCSILAVKEELKKRGIIASAFQLHPR